jgi:hypothetical protein
LLVAREQTDICLFFLNLQRSLDSRRRLVEHNHYWVKLLLVACCYLRDAIFDSSISASPFFFDENSSVSCLETTGVVEFAAQHHAEF